MAWAEYTDAEAREYYGFFRSAPFWPLSRGPFYS